MTKKQFLATLCLGAISLTSLPAFAGTTYEVPVKMMHAYEEGKVSMANQALKQTADIEVEDNGSDVTVLFKPMEFGGQKDGVNKLFVLEGSSRTEAKKGASKDKEYSEQFSFHSENKKPEKIKVAFWVDIMDQLAGGKPGSGEKDAFLNFDWNAAKTIATTPAAKPAPKTAQSNEAIQVVIQGQKASFTDAVPYIEDARTLVPVRFITESLGAKVAWDAKTQKVTVDKGDKTIVLYANKKAVQVTTAGNTKTIQLDVPAKIKNGRTFVPLRFISEAFGNKVGYRQENQHAIITID